ncbi:TPM domain-containing protein [Dokdonia ponticola]|uniref:TPM domain-containing protein n=1 Tax=Dokdonia ponticola TaxID=2041041 RepID=A0ABV9HZ03_9FLAO
MRIGTKLLILILTVSLLSCKGSTQETEKKEPATEFDFSGIKKKTFPESIGIINDYAQILTESQRKELTKTLYDYNIETTRQIVVVTVDRIKPYQNIQQYAVDLGNEWAVGDAEKNNGLTIVVCSQCQQIGIATGLGTELILTDSICKEVIDKTMIPEFKNGKFYNGIKKGVTEFITKWE